MKKLLSLILCLNILTMPVLAEYDFSDEAQAEFDKNQQIQTNDNFSRAKQKQIEQIPKNELLYYEGMQFQPVQQAQRQLLYGSVVTVPAGTSFNITFDSGISSGSLERNDRLAVRLTNDLEYNGTLIAPAGSLVYGSASDAKNAGYAYGNAEIELNFNEIMTPDGKLLQISTENIYMKTQSERAVKMTRDVVVGALGSMLVGALFTAMGGGHDWGRNMAIYGGLGALGGGIRGTMQRGEEVNIQDGTTIQVKLLQPLTAPAYQL